MIISVIGGGTVTDELARMAEEVGRELARRKVYLVCGGGGGVMEAACKGAKSAGGTTIGILSGSKPEGANPWVDIPICTGLGQGRNVIIARTGRAVIAVGGRFGTLSEIGHALRVGTPVVGLETWGLVKDGIRDPSIIIATGPVDAVEKALSAAQQSRSPAADSSLR